MKCAAISGPFGKCFGFQKHFLAISEMCRNRMFHYIPCISFEAQKCYPIVQDEFDIMKEYPMRDVIEKYENKWKFYVFIK